MAQAGFTLLMQSYMVLSYILGKKICMYMSLVYNKDFKVLQNDNINGVKNET